MAPPRALRAPAHRRCLALRSRWNVGLLLLAAGSARGGDRKDSAKQCVPCKPGPLPSPPSDVTTHNGIAWPTLCVDDSDGLPRHFFTIGDWGGYVSKDGPRTFDNTHHKRHFVDGVDNQAQWLVAQAMRKVAKTSRPEFVVNVGDNFYPGGYESRCGQKELCSMVNTGQFQILFEDMYDDPLLNKAAWHSVLGNHDFGGFSFNKGWDQQMAYTWHSDRWILPGLYWERRIQFCDYAVDMLFFDTNKFDALPSDSNPGHNICGWWHNRGSDCSEIGGPVDAHACHVWFRRLWTEQVQWLEDRLNQSTADWQILVTHFPPQWDKPLFKRLARQYGVDLIITGHRHQQEVHYLDGVLDLGGTAWIVTGGGGGCTSEGDPLQESSVLQQYGFMDISLTAEQLTIDMWSWRGKLRSSTAVTPVPRGGLVEEDCFRVNATALNGTGVLLTAAQLSSAMGEEGSINGSAVQGLEVVPCPLDTCRAIGCNRPHSAEYECQCNAQCLRSGDCCGDFEQVCHSALPRTHPPAPHGHGNAMRHHRRLGACDASRRRRDLGKGAWNGLAPGAEMRSCAFLGCSEGYVRNQACQCSPGCVEYLDCCDDYNETCASATALGALEHVPSCRAYGCGMRPVPRERCQCDAACRRRGDCCNDYQEQCVEMLDSHPVSAADMVVNVEWLDPESGPDPNYYFAALSTASREEFQMRTDLLSEPCLEPCGGRGGACPDFCGAGRACCRRGDPMPAPECADAATFLTDHFECVGQEAKVASAGQRAEAMAALAAAAFDDADAAEEASLRTSAGSAMAAWWAWTLAAGVVLLLAGAALLALDASRRSRGEWRKRQHAEDLESLRSSSSVANGETDRD